MCDGLHRMGIEESTEMTHGSDERPNMLRGAGVPLPDDMPELPDDLTIIARLIDANCRAHSEKYGFHLDSRCLSHYNEGIVRLAQAGVMDLVPVLDLDGNPKVRRVLRRNASGEETEVEEPVLYEEVTDAPAQAVRVRAQYVPYEKMTSRPTTDPMWKLQGEELARLRNELAIARGERRDPNKAPEIPEWLATAPRTPQPDPSTMPGSYFPRGFVIPEKEENEATP